MACEKATHEQGTGDEKEELEKFEVEKEACTDDQRLVQVDQLRPWKTTALMFGYMGLGISMSVLGPSLLSLELLFDTDTKTMASTYSYRSAGVVSGSLLCVVCYDRITNKERLFAAACFLQGVSLAVAPFAGSIIGFFCLITVEGFASTIMICGSAYCLKLWKDSKYKRTVLHASNLVWSVGSTLCPLVVRPFLPELPSDLGGRCGPPHNVTESTITEDTLTTNWTTNMLTGCEVNGTELKADDVDVLKVRFSYPVVSVVILLAGIQFGVLSFRSRTLPTGTSDPNDEVATVAYLRTRQHIWIMYGFICTFYLLYGWANTIPNVLLPVFAVKALGWSNADGSRIHAAFWGSSLATRAFIVVIGTTSPRLIILCGITLSLLGNSLLLFVHHDYWIIWLAVALTGIGNSCQYISFLLWVAEHMIFTGRSQALVSIGFATGAMTGPAIAGYLFQTQSHMSFVYILLGTSTAISLICLLLYFYFRLSLKKTKLSMGTSSP